MSFDLIIQEKNVVKSILLIDLDSANSIEIQAKGALMNSWKVKSIDSFIELIYGNTEPNNFEMNGFRSGKMSPFSCRIDEGTYHWNNQSFRFNKFYLGAHAMHGLLYDADFSIRATEINTDNVFVELGYFYQGTDSGFPFPYEIIIRWTLHKNHLITVRTQIKNQSDEIIPIMDGWHPYFTLGGKIDDYEIKFDATGKIEMNEEMIPTGKMKVENLFEDGKKLSTRHFDDCFLLNPFNNKITISHQNKSIKIEPIHNYPFLQIYTPEDRQSIAIENLSGAPNCFNNKMGLQKIGPHDEIYFETNYQFNFTQSQ